MTEETREIIERTIGHEGKFSSTEKDSGNWTGGKVGVGELKGTKYGISAAQYPDLDIQNLTHDDALAIYERDYYQEMNLGLIADARIRWKVFDVGVNTGPGVAVKMLQRCIGDPIVDGCIGKNTAAICNLRDPNAVLNGLVDEQIIRYNEIVRRDPTKQVFYEGWIRRAADKGEGL